MKRLRLPPAANDNSPMGKRATVIAAKRLLRKAGVRLIPGLGEVVLALDAYDIVVSIFRPAPLPVVPSTKYGLKLTQGPHSAESYGDYYIPGDLWWNTTGYNTSPGRIAGQSAAFTKRLGDWTGYSGTDLAFWWKWNRNVGYTRYAQHRLYKRTLKTSLSPTWEEDLQTEWQENGPRRVVNFVATPDPLLTPDMPGLADYMPHLISPGRGTLPPRRNANPKVRRILTPLIPLPIRPQRGEPSTSVPLPWQMPGNWRPGKAPIIITPTKPGYSPPAGDSVSEPVAGSDTVIPPRPPKAPHVLRPPRPGEKERKSRAMQAFKLIGDAFGGFTEFNDIIGAAWKALPKHRRTIVYYRGKSVTGWKTKWRDVYDHADEMDISDFIHFYLKAQITDEVIGRSYGGANKRLPGRIRGVNRLGGFSG